MNTVKMIETAETKAQPTEIHMTEIEEKYGEGAFISNVNSDNQLSKVAVVVRVGSFLKILAKADTVAELL